MIEEQREIGARIAAARREAGLSQRELAERLGVTTRSVQNYESGAVIPYKHLRRIETLGHKRIGWILAGDASESDLARTLERLEASIDRHFVLLQEQLDTLRRETDHLRDQRDAADRRRRGTSARH